MAHYFQQLKQFITQDDFVQFSNLVQKLPLAKLPEEKVNQFLQYLATIIINLSTEKIKYLQIILTYFDHERHLIDRYPALLKLLLTLELPMALWLKNNYPQINLADYCLKILYTPTGLSEYKRINKLFKPMDPNIWAMLYDCTENHQNNPNLTEFGSTDADIYDDYEYDDIKTYIKKQLEKAIIIPKYILPVNTNPIPPYPDLPQPDQALKLIKAKLFTDKLALNETVFQQHYAVAPAVERAKLLGWDESKYDDQEIFRHFGPVNSFGRFPVEEDYECSIYGGCRMLLCNEFEDDHWFRASCDKCNKSIPKKSYAVRKANLAGGWTGCYCSFTCIEGTEAELQLMENIREQITHFGIYE